MNKPAAMSLPASRGLLRGLVVCLGFLAGTGVAEASPPLDEYIIKAAALVELSPYIKFPEAQPGRNFVITVLGRSPFGTRLDSYARGRTVQGRKIEVRYAARAAELQPCDLIFICRSERRNLPEILEWSQPRAVLTVTDDEDLIGKGVIIDMVDEADRVKLYVNLRAAAAHRISVSSQLLSLAKIVEPH